MPRSIPCLLLAVVAMLVAPCARADVPQDALALVERGEGEQAAALLDAWLRTQPAPEASALVAARAAARTGDSDLLERLQGWLDGRPEAREPGPVALALATAWLARAELQLASGTGGSATGFLLADAAAKATACLQGPLGSEALALLARSHWVRGDSARALAVLGEHAPLATAPAPALLEARVRYEQALAAQLGPDGRPTPEGTASLQRVAALLGGALEALGTQPGVLLRDEVAFARITRAYALHRLGDEAAATAAYEAAHLGSDGRSSAALRGLKSLLAHDPDAYRRALRGVLAEREGEQRASEALVASLLEAGALDGALQVAEARSAAAPRAVDGPVLAGSVLLAADRLDEAAARFLAAHRLDPARRDGVAGLERVAAAWMKEDVERGIALYERIFDLLPTDPYVRNNLGFLLREAVTPFTTEEPHGVQHLKPDAPWRVRAWLQRSVAAYEEAVRLLPASDDKDLDEAAAWNVAGVVNDLGLMLHYFADVQDLPRAEALYWRALRMTGFAFKDTYAPNLQRLYGTLLRDREWAWYLAARRARDAILLETGEVDRATGNPVLAADTAKREAASRDLEALRERLVRTLREDAESDGLPFPPPPAPTAAPGGDGK